MQLFAGESGLKYFRVKNWESFQHYKDRNPPWIKLHREILSSRTWVMLDDDKKALAVACMLLAACNDNKVPLDPEYVMRVAYLKKKPDLQPLVDTDFIEIIEENKNALADASKPEQKQAEFRPEESREEKINVRLEDAKRVIDRLNEKTGSRYRHVDANINFVRARFEEGYSVDDCFAVIDAKAAEWLGKPEFEKYLRPETLFNKTKFAGYSGQVGSGQIAGTDL